MVARKDHDNSKSLFKRKRGLSKFYANKSQSFSTLDHAMMTCLGHSALALEKPRQRSVEPAPKSDVDMEVTSRAMQRLQNLVSRDQNLERRPSATSDLCTVLELSSLAHCDSELSSATVESGVNLSTERDASGRGRLAYRQEMQAHSCPLPRCESDNSLEVSADSVRQQRG